MPMKEETWSIFSWIERPKAGTIDSNNPEVKARIAETLEAQKKILKRKNIDRKKLENTYVTI
jgi:hypothetical protein